MDKKDIKNVIFVSCLIFQAVFFMNSFDQLTTLVETNNPYIQTNQIPSNNYQDLEIGTYEEEGQRTYVGTQTLEIYTYKLLQTILLLFGIFMCLVFLAINNQNYSIIEQLEGKTQNE